MSKRSQKKNRGSAFAKRSLGQNFLVDQQVIEKILAAAGDIENSLVIEVGPGRGALTELLSQRAGKLVAVELDTRLSALLRVKFEKNERVEIIERDILETDLEELIQRHSGFEDVRIVANLPYNISTPVLEKFGLVAGLIERAVLMLQREVVNRISAAPGKSGRGLLSVWTERFFEVSKLFDVVPESFVPVPKVMSAVALLVPKREFFAVDACNFRFVLGVGFQQKRKTILNNFRSLDRIVNAESLLRVANIDPRKRPEALDLDSWIRLAEVFRQLESPDYTDTD